MKTLNEALGFIEKGMCENGGVVATACVYSMLLKIKDELSVLEFEHKDSLSALISMLENGFDPNNFYQTDDLYKAKRLAEY